MRQIFQDSTDYSFDLTVIAIMAQARHRAYFNAMETCSNSMASLSQWCLTCPLAERTKPPDIKYSLGNIKLQSLA